MWFNIDMDTVMNRKKLAKRLIALILFILIVNFIATEFYWYSSIWYFDMIMHTLGGLWLGLLAFYFFSPNKISTKLVLQILFFVLLIGLGWEVFEFIVGKVIVKNGLDILDTSSDLFFDLVGGGLSILYFFKRIMRTVTYRVQ